MIGVIADDFSGAAEVAGAAFAAGFSAEVHVGFDKSSDADVVVLDTASRGLPPREAEAVAADAASALSSARPEWIFKKVDSLLRGSVAAEVDAVRRTLGMQRAVVVPANPAMGRTIRAGRYLVNGVPLDASPLAADAEQRRATAAVMALLDDTTGRIHIPDAMLIEDLHRLARQVGRDTLPAGSSAYFDALLEARPPAGRERAPRAARHPQRRGGLRPVLFVCGSLAAWRAGRSAEAQKRGLRVVPFPQTLLERVRDAHVLAEFVRQAAGQGDDVLIAIGQGDVVDGVAPEELLDRLATAAERLCDAFGDLFVEGGATASAIVRHRQWGVMSVVASHAPGVVTLVPRDDARLVTVKVGSYEWPEDVWPAT